MRRLLLLLLALGLLLGLVIVAARNHGGAGALDDHDIASLIVVAIHPGINDIQVSAAPSPLRGACFAVSAAVWLVLLAWLGIAAFRCELSARPSPV